MPPSSSFLARWGEGRGATGRPTAAAFASAVREEEGEEGARPSPGKKRGMTGPYSTPLPLGSQSQFRGRRVRKSSKAQVLDWDLLKEDEEEEGLLIPPFSSFLFPPSEKDQ